MNYRNIDNDYRLYNHVGRFYRNELTKTQLVWILKEANYSDREINNALNDYFEIHIRSNNIAYYLIVASSFIILGLYFLHKVLLWSTKKMPTEPKAF